jgi:GT2 family glycosyltransferase
MFSSLLSSLSADLSYEIILIDDASSDATVEWLKNLDHGFVKKIFNPNNLGYAKSNNIAVTQAKGEILALINNDLIFEPGWFEGMLDVLENPYLNAGIVGNIQYKVIDNSLDHAGVQLTPTGKVEHIQVLSPESSAYSRVFAVTGACCMIRKSDFDALSGFDEGYVNGGEDIDLCLALKQRGKSAYIATNSQIHHHVSLSRDRASIQNEKNSRRLLAKWRNVLKTEMARQWLLRLQQPNSYHNLIDGEFYQAFLKSPQMAARLIAEYFILIEEHRWSKLIDNIDLNQDIASRTLFKGLRFIDSHNLYLIDSKPEVIVKGVASVVNFYVCGRRIDPGNQDNIAIKISVNHVQHKILRLESEPNINLGIISPILLPSMDNVFKIEVNFIDPNSFELLGDASHLIYISHFVIDDKLVKNH